MSRLGVPDRPIEGINEDVLGVKDYANALAEFVLRCDTPITVGIQGDWGAGKTSLMNMVQESLACQEAETAVYCETVWFNTWMYSQFDLGDQLPLLMLSSFVKSLVGDRTDLDEKISGFVSWIKKVGPNIVAKQLAGMSMGELTGDAAGALRDDVNLLDQLKSKFKELCQKKLTGHPGGRIVFFVDDLDRLRPEKAVELLEVMKTFLDVPGVVFVLACDYNVIAQGVEAKFGVTNLQTGGRSFFDKIIQVPFQMPVHSYDLERYVSTLLQRLKWKDIEEKDLHEVYRPLLEFSVGFNPRTIKRLFNSILLLNLVLSRGEEGRRILDDGHMMKLLFAIVCMQMAHDPLHTYLTSLLTAERLNSLQSEKDLAEAEILPTEEITPNLVQFASLFHHLVDKDGNKKISQEELDDLQTVFKVSNVTSMAAASSKGGGSGRRRWDLDALLEYVQETHQNEQLTDKVRDFYRFFAENGARINFGTGQTGSYTVYIPFRGHTKLVRTASVFGGGQLVVSMADLRTTAVDGTCISDVVVTWTRAAGLQFQEDQSYPSLDFRHRPSLLDDFIEVLQPFFVAHADRHTNGMDSERG